MQGDVLTQAVCTGLWHPRMQCAPHTGHPLWPQCSLLVVSVAQEKGRLGERPSQQQELAQDC